MKKIAWMTAGASGAIGALALLASPGAMAQDFPTRTVTIVVPYNAGGGTDGAARALAKGLSQKWGKPVIVENVGGADGLIGTQRVARARADGYTVVLSVPNLLLFKHMHTEATVFNATAALTPVSLIARYPVVLMASNQSGIRSTADVQKKCKEAAANCSWGSGEQFSWLAGKSLLDAMGVANVTAVPYRGTAPVVNDLLGGHVTLGVGALASPLPHYKSGALRLVSTLSKTRAPAAADVPTVDEAGVRDVSISDGWYGLFAPKGVAPETLRAWDTALKQMQKDPDVLASLDVLTAQPVFSSADEFAVRVGADEKSFDALLLKHPLPK